MLKMMEDALHLIFIAEPEPDNLKEKQKADFAKLTRKAVFVVIMHHPHIIHIALPTPSRIMSVNGEPMMSFYCDILEICPNCHIIHCFLESGPCFRAFEKLEFVEDNNDYMDEMKGHIAALRITVLEGKAISYSTPVLAMYNQVLSYGAVFSSGNVKDCEASMMLFKIYALHGIQG